MVALKQMNEKKEKEMVALIKTEESEQRTTNGGIKTDKSEKRWRNTIMERGMLEIKNEIWSITKKI